ncbi:AIR synthase related protein [Nocardia salmonicida]|uniref:AIR synthase related protein n=1 Tax=Nocardia salmonicida TaxID=53431 RepID=UPI002E29D85B|nr:AIR synthase related protein [Nocardia salmonicida]
MTREWRRIDTLKEHLGLAGQVDQDYDQWPGCSENQRWLSTVDGGNYSDALPGEPISIWAFRIVSAAISDLAVGGADAVRIHVDLTVPSEIRPGDLEGIALGIRTAVDSAGAEIANGNNLRVGPWSLSVAANGTTRSVSPRGRAGLAGDLIVVSGVFGMFNVALQGLNNGNVDFDIGRFSLGEALLGGFPELHFGRMLNSMPGVTSAIDANDCVFKCCHDLARASGLTVAMDPKLVKEVGKAYPDPPSVHDLVGHPHGDLRLVFSIPPDLLADFESRVENADREVFVIGEMVDRRDALVTGIEVDLDRPWKPAPAFSYPVTDALKALRGLQQIGGR